MELVNDIFALASELGLEVDKSVPEYEALSSIASQIGLEDYSYTPDGNQKLYEQLNQMRTEQNIADNYNSYFNDDEEEEENSTSQNSDMNSKVQQSINDAGENSNIDKPQEGSKINDNNRFNRINNSQQESDNPLMDRSVRKRQYGNNLMNKESSAGDSLADSAKEAAKDNVKDSAKEAAKDAVKEKAKEEAADAAKKAVAKKATETAAKETAKKAAASSLLKNPYFWIIIGILVLIVALVILIVVIVNGVDNQKYGTGEFPYVPMEFDENVTLTINGESQTMPIDDYVACVLNGEVGETTLSDDQLKAFAIAIRSNVLSKGGSVGSGTGFQVAKCQSGVTDPGTHLHDIADETTGLVLITGEGENASFYYSMYDELAYNESCGGSEKDGIITICQKGVQVPREWLNSHGKSDARIDHLKDYEYHGQGMSQMGAYYLALEEGYDYKELLSLFYGDDNAYIISLYPPRVVDVDLDIIETDTDWPELDEAIADLLSSHGSSITIANDALRDAVISAGPGTRQAVATAAIYINNLVAQYEVQLPYFYAGGWGDWYSNDKNVNYYYGINPYWGNYAYNGTNPENYQHLGLDCASFVSWALHNGGLTYPSGDIPNYKWLDEVDYYSVFDTSSYIGQPGDILVHPGHVRLIVGYYEEGNDKGYYVAEASGYANDVFIAKRSIDSFGDSEEVGDMSYFYKNNVISDYKSAFEEGRLD